MRTSLPLFFALLFISGFAFSQDDLDDIFDDGDSNSDIDIAIGTDLITTIGGTPNIYAEIDFIQRFGLQAGLGLVPFGYLMDLSRRAFFGNKNGFNRDIGGGFFFNVAFKYIQAYGDAFKWYYYLESKNWSMFEVDSDDIEVATLKRNRVSFGSGYAYKPFNNFGFDGHLGFSVSMDRTVATGTTEQNPQIKSGLDLGIGAFYNF